MRSITRVRTLQSRIYFPCLLLGMLLAVPLFAWTPPDSLVGHWQQTFEANAVFIKQPNGRIHPDSAVQVNIHIHADGRVSGNVGASQLVKCRVKKNRTWLGRALNFKTDFIIRGGTLEGAIFPGDQITQREFTIPFNIEDGTIRGSIMVLQRWKYPYPLLPRLRLQNVAPIQ